MRRVGGRYNSPATFGSADSKPREANLVLSNEEIWDPTIGKVDPKGKASVRVFNPGASGLSILDTEAARFDIYRIRSCQLYYKPSCGTTQSGRFVMGIDYDTIKLPTTVASLTSMQPQTRPQVFRPASLRVDPSRANKQTWLRTANGLATETGAFAVGYTADLSTPASVGELWCRYVVEFSNPRTPGASYNARVRNGVNYGQYANDDTARWNFTGDKGIAPEINQPGVYAFTTNGWPDIETLSKAIDSWNLWITSVGGEMTRLMNGFTTLSYYFQLWVPAVAFTQAAIFQNGRRFLRGPIAFGPDRGIHTATALGLPSLTVDSALSNYTTDVDSDLDSILARLKRLEAIDEEDDESDNDSVVRVPSIADPPRRSKRN